MPQTDIWDFLGFDKFAHLFTFGVLVLLMIVGFTKQYKFLYLRYHAVRLSVAGCIMYGLLLELIQALIPGRNIEYLDMIADSVGCFLGLGLFYAVYKSP